nr:hypothetical protein [Tanacetum cinerariifolium]
ARIWLPIGGERDNARVVARVVGMRFFSWSGKDSLDDMSMMLVLAIFLGGFLVEEEALEAFFGGEQMRTGIHGTFCRKDQGCTCQPDQFVLELELEMEMMMMMILRMFEGEVFFRQPRTYVPTIRERNHDMVHNVLSIGYGAQLNGENMPIKASEEYSIGKHHQVTFDHTNHFLSHVIGEVEWFLVVKTLLADKDQNLLEAQAEIKELMLSQQLMEKDI